MKQHVIKQHVIKQHVIKQHVIMQHLMKHGCVNRCADGHRATASVCSNSFRFRFGTTQGSGNSSPYQHPVGNGTCGPWISADFLGFQIQGTTSRAREYHPISVSTALPQARLCLPPSNSPAVPPYPYRHSLGVPRCWSEEDLPVEPDLQKQLRIALFGTAKRGH